MIHYYNYYYELNRLSATIYAKIFIAGEVKSERSDLEPSSPNSPNARKTTYRHYYSNSENLEASYSKNPARGSKLREDFFKIKGSLAYFLETENQSIIDAYSNALIISANDILILMAAYKYCNL